MRPNTSSSGILRTKRRRPVSTSMLTRMLVPKPKNAFQSPGVHIAGRFIVASVMPRSPVCCPAGSNAPVVRRGRSAQRGEHRLRRRHPAENAALGLDHAEAHFVEFREVGGAAVGEHDAAIAGIVPP